jgi:hypothetical protein
VSVCYGISLGHCHAYGDLIRGGGLNKFFGGLEISGRALENKLAMDSFRKKPLKYRHLVELMPPSVTRGISDQKSGIVKGFKEQFELSLEKLSFLGIEALVVDFGLETAFSNPEFRASCLALIKSFSHALHKRRMTLLLPVRIPFSDPEYPEFLLSFSKDLMYPGVKFSINIYPHELIKGFSPEDLLRWFRFDIGVVRMIYEPEMGNRLVEKLVFPWIDYLSENMIFSKMTFCPRISDKDYFLEEMDKLKEMLSKMEKS